MSNKSRENYFRKKMKEELEPQGYIIWIPPRNRFAKEEDIFSIWDALAWKGTEMKRIQLTSKGNIKARERKIEEYHHKHGVYKEAEVWGWDDKKKEFKKVFV